ncbi:hypothetical protein OVA24_14590 [Luteolibacter sp. SL250]|uniref:hypothetical protein n=1 Tax=Luteolibacter sp. SL250 TaxID=2995170 RepID=UPI00226E069C|nr:hypothetical protein [Luteolibacter sp. SL250]WAC18460.1 hypothetical protein OVA24_14590 [Luteolibacter sp. SL250]
MSFGDLMSSGRGPGVVGLLMALLVIGGFGGIYVFVFDKEMQGGGSSIEYVVREQADEIESLQVQIAHDNTTLENSKKGAQAGKKADVLSAEAAATKEKIGVLEAQMSKIIADTVTLEKEFLDYRTGFRTQVREDAVGEKFPTLKTVSGSEYVDVEIREVTEVGISIRHRDGSKRITYEELTEEWQQRFQFDPKEKAEALAREQAEREMYERSLAGNTGADAVAADEPEAPAEVLKDPATAEGSEQIRRLVTAKEIQLARLKTQWGQLQAAAVKVQEQESAERARGVNGMAKVKEMRMRISTKEREIAKATMELHQLKRQQR